MPAHPRRLPMTVVDLESGHLILILMVGLTVMAILLTAVVQQWSIIERRNREEELILRGNQYVKAIRLYQSEHGGALPTRLEDLVKPGPRRLRYIRKLFRDPMAPDGKWGILLADPTGKGYINPNAPPPEEQSVEGLDDLGKGFRFGSSLDAKINASTMRNNVKQKAFFALSGVGFFEPGGSGDATGEESVTAPGQPPGPIVGVVSLYFQSSFRRYKEKENYADWVFHIFDLPGQIQQQQPQNPVPQYPAGPGGIGPGAAYSIKGLDGKTYGTAGSPPPMHGFPGKGRHPPTP